MNPEPEAKPAQEAAKPAAAKVAKKRTASDAQGRKSKQVEAKQTGKRLAHLRPSYLATIPLNAVLSKCPLHAV